MCIEAIYTAAQAGDVQVSSTAVQVKLGMGIVGDRYFAKRKNQQAKNITLIESEEIAHFNAVFAQQLSLKSLRRNIVTRDVRLNGLVGSEFMLGEVRLWGIELCEPCGKLGRLLAAETGLSSNVLLQHWVHRAGLRAEVLSNGVLRQADALLVIP